MYITMFWAFIALILGVQNHIFLLATQQSGFEHYDFGINMLTTLLIVPFAGFFGGGIIVYFLKEQLRKLPVGAAIIADTVIIVLAIIVVSIPATLVYNSIYFSKPPWNSFIIVHALDYLFSVALLHTILFWSLIVVLTLVVLQVNEKYGQGVLWKMLKGKYYRPRVEERIFMFLDIRGSTSIAERLGHVKWFELLNRFFNDISESIIDTKGEIYQYVGDEIIVQWDIQSGIEDWNCVRCFFEIQNKIQSLASAYTSKYDTVPKFKAALHCGDVTIGEIGKIKKDIVYTGDVLNTTARIQELCNSLHQDFLISEQVTANLPASAEFELTLVGDTELRGKETHVSVYTVRKLAFDATQNQIQKAVAW